MPKINNKIHPIEYLFHYEDYDKCPICNKILYKKSWKNNIEWIIDCVDCKFWIHFYMGSWDLRLKNKSIIIRFVNYYSKEYRKKHDINKDIKKAYRFYNELIKKNQEYKNKEELDYFVNKM